MAIIRGQFGAGRDDLAGFSTGNVSLLTQGRAKGILRKIGILEDGRSSHPMDRNANGEVALYKRAIGKSNGIQFPVNFKMTFNPPTGINQPVLSSHLVHDTPRNAWEKPRGRREPTYKQTEPKS